MFHTWHNLWKRCNLAPYFIEPMRTTIIWFFSIKLFMYFKTTLFPKIAFYIATKSSFTIWMNSNLRLSFSINRGVAKDANTFLTKKYYIVCTLVLLLYCRIINFKLHWRESNTSWTSTNSKHLNHCALLAISNMRLQFSFYHGRYQSFP